MPLVINDLEGEHTHTDTQKSKLKKILIPGIFAIHYTHVYYVGGTYGELFDYLLQTVMDVED